MVQRVCTFNEPCLTARRVAVTSSPAVIRSSSSTVAACHSRCTGLQSRRRIGGVSVLPPHRSRRQSWSRHFIAQFVSQPSCYLQFTGMLVTLMRSQDTM